MVVRSPSDSMSRSRFHGRRMSFDEFLALPEEKPYLEYVCGRAVQKMSPRPAHADISGEIQLALGAYRKLQRGKTRPECRVFFETPSGRESRVPDVSYWAPDKPLGGEVAGLPPSLAVEVRSPDETMASQREKCRFYRAHGVDACWLIDPVRRIVERFEGEADAERVPAGGALTSAYLPGFVLPLAELFGALDA
jgi:Uma2 family endonuclease